MTQPGDSRINEVDFCGVIATAAESLFGQHRDAFAPFVSARIEGYGSARGRNKRKDLRFYDAHQRQILCGEVKLPGSQDAFNTDLVQNAHDKAEDAKVQFFFTWDVNRFVLWDRSKWQHSLLDRRVKVWPLRQNFSTPQEVGRQESLDFITRHFLPDLLRDLAEIVSGRRRDWALPPDELFLRSLESHLDWPVKLIREYLFTRSTRERGFDRRFQEWLVAQDRTFVRNQPDEWRETVDNAARTIAYVWANRLIFYKALRASFGELPRLEFGRTITDAQRARARLEALFKRAAERSGDYETLLFPESRDWAAPIAFEPPGAVDAWRGFLRGIESVDFRDVPSDIVGRIFQKLVSPEERHRYGQHFTGDDPVDLINAFCIRDGASTVLDPACGSGSFLVRAYYRKRTLAEGRLHADMIAELFGCDIAVYPAHLATLNLAAREINVEANYPRIAREDFFDYRRGRAFCQIPEPGTTRLVPVLLPPLGAVVGNPPYVRQERINKLQKRRAANLAAQEWPDLSLSGRSDIHCYFWPHATSLLMEGGYFGFLTSAQWLDVDYGFALQRWILRNFRIIAILESGQERWFTDARVKTCITILQRCADRALRDGNLVRFVRFEKRLEDLIGVPPGSGYDGEDAERQRQASVDRLRDLIEATSADIHTDDWRILVKRQADLWNEGVRAAVALSDGEQLLGEASEGGTEDESDEAAEAIAITPGDYVAGKWGRYLRAPDLYFDVMRRFGGHFVPLGEIVQIRRGITSGCDAFFMPWDVTDEMLDRFEEEREFKRACNGAARRDVESGHLRIVRDGAGTYHPIEAEFVKPEVHSLMSVDRPVIRARDLHRVVLLADEPVSRLPKWVRRYIQYGEEATFQSSKSRPVPVPERSTCAARDPWYALPTQATAGFAFWPMAQQYRHIIPANPEHLICNHNLFELSAEGLRKAEREVLVAILNCTLIGLFKTFYGRFAGTEGNLKTEVIDVNLIDVPDPRGASDALRNRLTGALRKMQRREVGHLVEEELRECHTYERARRIADRPVALSVELQQDDRRELDDAVFELLGVGSSRERAQLVDDLHIETAQHFRQIRVVEIQKMEDRAKGTGTRFNSTDLAADAWDALDLPDFAPLPEWVAKHASSASEAIVIPRDRPVTLQNGTMFDTDTVYFGAATSKGGGRRKHIVCKSRGQAELIARMAELGVVGEVIVPTGLKPAMQVLDRLNVRHDAAAARLRELAESRTSEQEVQEQVLSLLHRWYVMGRPGRAVEGNNDVTTDQ